MQELYSDEPSAGHEERFEQRLLQHERRETRRLVPYWVWIGSAAAVLIGFIVTIAISETKKQNERAAESQAEPIIPEVEAARAYYAQHAISESEVNQHADDAIKRMMSEMRRLEEEYKKLDSLLANNYSNERLVNAMVENYQFRLRIAEQLRKYIELKNRTFTPQHETTSNS